MRQTDELMVDPHALTDAQRMGDACIVCRKKWPRPRIRVGRLPDSSGVFACDDCAPTPPAACVPQSPRVSTTGAGLPTSPPPRTTAIDAAVMEVAPGRRVTRAFGGKPGTAPKARPTGGGRARLI